MELTIEPQVRMQAWRYVRQQVKLGLERRQQALEKDMAETKHISAVVDLILDQEAKCAAQEDRETNYLLEVINDEVSEGQVRETTLLGHFVPQGTHMLILLNGPETTQPGIIGIDEKIRSLSSQKAASQRGIKAWEPETVRRFQPDHWLVESGNRTWSFDSQAGPLLPFSAGMGGCYGRKLTYLKLKVLLTLLIWRFELLPCAPSLSSYGGLERLTRGLNQCYFRLRTLAVARSAITYGVFRISDVV